MIGTELKTKSYSKAKRYLENAIDILKTKANKQGRFYEDEKYVRMACGTAYSGTLIALDAYLLLKRKEIKRKKHQRKSVDDYLSALSDLDKKLLKEFFNAYEILHLVGYYDGNTNYELIKVGMNSAAEIINKIKPNGLHE